MKSLKIPLLPCLALLSALLLPALPATAQDWAGRARVRGIVSDQDGNPIAEATVTLRLNGEGPDALITDDKGEWTYFGLNRGSWVVRAEAPGYVPAEAEVSVSSFDKGREAIKIALRPVPPEQLGPSPRELLERGNALLEEGKTAEARAEYEAALAKIALEEHPVVLVTIARTHYLEGNSEQSEATLRRALEIDPDNLDALKLLSNLLVSAGREQEAQEFLARLPEGEELPADAYLNAGIELYNQNDLEGARAAFEKVVAAYPEEANAYYYRGLVSVAQGQNEGAAADFNKFLEIESEGARADEVREFLSFLEP